MGLDQRLQQRAKGIRFHTVKHAALGPDRQHISRQERNVYFPMPIKLLSQAPGGPAESLQR
jgi:hypothetical protein